MSVTARMAGGLASVVVDCAGPPERTKRCIAALLRHTRRPWELIAVADVGGESAAYLDGIRDAAPVYVEVVPPPDDPAAFRHAPGIASACGDYLALVDAGAIVTDGWLDGLAALADWAPEVGMVGPMLDDADPPQRAEGADASDPVALRRFAERWRAEHPRQWITTDRLAGSCALLRRHLHESVAASPVRSFDDLAARLLARGLSLAVNRELFVHHSGDEPGPRKSARLAPKGVAVDFVLPSARARDRGHGPGPRVSLTMIVRDEEHNLGPCLESAAGLFDEVVIVDTGSTDRTAEIARSFGAKVVPFAWIDDFAAARNVALDHAAGRYAFWLDADDRIDEVNRDRLRDLFSRLDGEPAAYAMKQLSTGRDGSSIAVAADHVRLFPLRDDVRWTYRVHEQILPAITAAGVPVNWTEIGIGHVGYVDADLCDHKLDRNLRILRAELIEKPGNPLVLFNIGWAALYRDEPKAALGYLRASLAAASPRDAIVRKVYALIAQACQRLGDADSALAACMAGRSLAPDDAGLLFSEAQLRLDRGDVVGAESCWRRILEVDRPRNFSIVAAGVHGHLTRRKLADLAERRGDVAEAMRLWDGVLADCPDDPDARRARARLARPSYAIVAAAG